MAGVLQDERAAALRGSIAGRREDGGAVPGVRYLAQNRLPDLRGCGCDDWLRGRRLRLRDALLNDRPLHQDIPCLLYTSRCV